MLWVLASFHGQRRHLHENRTTDSLGKGSLSVLAGLLPKLAGEQHESGASGF